MTPGWIRPLFVVAAAYDLILGVVFGIAFKPIMTSFGIALPNHDAYVQLPAAMIAVFGIGFGFVAADPPRNRDIIKLFSGLRVSDSFLLKNNQREILFRKPA